ncbi:MAG: ADP compounds hydrolase NudE [bacterium]|nr:ADP compounds hydrolase NudE [bacterium]
MTVKPRILKRELIATTRIFRVEQLDLEFANGERRCYERILGGPRGAVLVVPLLDADTVLLIREYAAGSERYELALPKGRIEAGEEIMEAADREIREEIGYGARDLSLLRSVTVAPGYLQHRTHMILARDLFPSRLPGDEPEPIEVVPWKLDNLDALLEREDFSESRSILALLLALRHLSTDSSGGSV